MRKPTIITRNLKREYLYKVLIEELRNTNCRFDEEDYLKVVHHRKKLSRFGNHTLWSYIIEMSGRTFEKTVRRVLTVDFVTRKATEHLSVTRCYKC